MSPLWLNMATEAISEMINISIAPIHCGNCFWEVLSQTVELSQFEKCEIKTFFTSMVTIATGVISEMVNIAKTPTHGGYCFREVLLQKSEKNGNKQFGHLWLPWQRQLFGNGKYCRSTYTLCSLFL
jgi:hypothetical protein